MKKIIRLSLLTKWWNSSDTLRKQLYVYGDIYYTHRHVYGDIYYIHRHIYVCICVCVCVHACMS